MKNKTEQELICNMNQTMSTTFHNNFLNLASFKIL